MAVEPQVPDWSEEMDKDLADDSPGAQQRKGSNPHLASGMSPQEQQDETYLTCRWEPEAVAKTKDLTCPWEAIKHRCSK